MVDETLKNICIIGAGPAGLVALKTVLNSPHYHSKQWSVQVFEAREDVGGVWLPADNLSDGSAQCQPLPSTPLYDSLTTNLPHPVMCFSSFPFPPETPLFPRAAAVEAYLRNFTDHFGLLPHIRLRSRVDTVGWNYEKHRWRISVSVSSVNGMQHEDHDCDLLFVCNGHHNRPRYPIISGLQSWLDEGLASHSMYYRNPVASIPFSDLSKITVLVVGGGPSGIDVASDLLDVAGRVVFSSSGKGKGPPTSSGSSEKAPVTKPRTSHFDLRTKTITFTDGTEEKIDYCILATGYEVDFPFFEGRVPNSLDDIRESILPMFSLPKVLSSPVEIASKSLVNSTWGVSPLARHVLPFPGFAHSMPSSSFADFSEMVSEPPPTSIAFLGLLVRVAPLPLVECQARAAVAAFAHASSISPDMWRGEEDSLLQRKESLKAQYISEGGHPESYKIEEYISKQWQRIPEDEQFEYRDALDELAHLLSESTTPPHKTKPWEKEIYAHKGPLRSAWRALEARGEAEHWIAGVGKGESTGKDGRRRTAEEEWVDLMWRVLDWWEREETGTGGSQHVHLYG